VRREGLGNNEVLHMLLPLPSAWNVGPIPTEPVYDENGREIGRRLIEDTMPLAPLPQSACEVYPPGSMAVRRETARFGAAALIWHEGKLVGVLEPKHIARILKFWAEHGVRPEAGDGA
jgi:hypothetical protein